MDDVSASFERGTSTAIIGKSGSGKTSLASIVGLLNNDYDGTLSYDGRDCAAWNDADRRASAAGMSASCSRTTPSYRI